MLLINLLQIKFTSLQDGFQFQIRIDDDDHPDSDDLIDRVFVTERSLAISDTFTPRRTYTGIYRNVQIDLSYRAICQTNYYGSLCTVFCSGRNDSGGHYECNGEGERVCLTGWTDLQNNCLTRKLAHDIVCFMMFGWAQPC